MVELAPFLNFKQIHLVREKIFHCGTVKRIALMLVFRQLANQRQNDL